MFTFIGYALFYSYFGNNVGNKNISESLQILKFINNPSNQYLISQFFNFSYNLLRFVIFFSPLFLLVIYLRVRFYHVVVLLLMVLSAIFTAIITNGILDNGQFFYNVIPIFNIFFAYLILEYTCLKSIKIIIPILLLLLSINIYSDFKFDKTIEQFYNKISLYEKKSNLDVIEKDLNGKLNVGTYDLSENEFRNLDLKSTYHYNKHLYLFYSNKVFDLLNLTMVKYVNNNDELSSADLFLFKQSEIYYFLNQKNFELNNENIELLEKKLNVTFRLVNDKIQL